MKTRIGYAFSLLGLGVVCLYGMSPMQAAEERYHLLREIPVREGGAWAAIAADESARRLYAAHGNRIEVIQIDGGTPVGVLSDTADVRGLVVAPGFHMGFASSGKDQSVSLIDLNTVRTTSKMKTGANPAAVVFEPSTLRVFAFCQGDQSATVGRWDDGGLVGTVELSGKPGAAAVDSALLDSKAGRVFVSMEDKNEVAVIGASARKISAHWPVAPGERPGGLAYDATNRVLFVACANGTVAALNGADGKLVSKAEIGQGGGDLCFDGRTQELICSAADGTLTIFHAEAAGKLTVVQTLTTRRGVTGLAWDGKRIYVGAADFGPAAASMPLTELRGACPTPGSLRILVYGK